MEDNIEQMPFYDSLNLQVTEKSFYNTLTGNIPLFPNQHPVFNPKSLSQPPSVTVNHGLSNLDSSTAKLLAQNIFNDVDSLSKFRRGLEEATRFLPPGPKLVAGLDSKGKEPINTLGKNSYGLKGRKNHERSNKKSGLSLVNESDSSDAFDRVVMLSVENVCNENCSLQSETVKAVEPGGVKGHPKNQAINKETINLRNLLMMCSQSVYANDKRAANKLLKQIRQHFSPSGDAL
ncbi:Scarecrow-like protein 33 [Glycine max]|nr:Scarecrow-like protein 33 [Glycine max]